MKKKILACVYHPVTWIVILWCATLFTAALLSDFLLPYSPSFPYAESILYGTELPRSIYSWANFDGVHYLTIADVGYGYGLLQAFFPVFPFILRFGEWVSGSAMLFGLFVNLLSAGVFLFLWYDLLIQSHVRKKTAILAMSTFVAFPTSFYLLSLYTESIFLLLLICIMRAVHKKSWILAACLTGIASATRLIGILLVPNLVIALLSPQLHTAFSGLSVAAILRELQHKMATVVLIVILGSTGLMGYMWFLYSAFADPLYFFHVQAEFGGGRQESFVLLPQVFFRYLKILATYRPIGLAYYASVQELVLTLLIGAGVVVAWRKRIVPPYQVVFSLAAMILPTLTGTLSSMPRYVLVALPAFMAFGWFLEKHPRLTPIWLCVSTFFLVFNTILFVQGYWVA